MFDMMPMPLLWALIAFIAVLGAVPPMMKLAPALGLLDQPDKRKQHEGRIPLIGGLVILPVFMGLSFLAGDTWETHWPLYSAMGLLLLTGAVDDKIYLHPLIKFGIQFIAAALIVLPGGAQIHQLGNLFGLGDVGLDWMSLPFSIISVVLLINAINLIDGLDGLAGGTVFIIAGWFLMACLATPLAGVSVFTPSLLILLGALAGFLCYNMRSPWRKKAAIFMGDAGSLSLGLLVAWYAIQLSPENLRVIQPISVAWIIALPIWDECAQFYRRVREGKHPFWPDRGHFHHHFITAGLPAGRAVLILHALVFITGALGVLGTKGGLPLPLLTSCWIAGLLGHMAFSANLARYPALISKLFKIKTPSSTH